MWARVVEFMLGCWLAVSPFVFRHENPQLWTLDFALSLAVMVLALVSYWHPLRFAHLVLIVLALAMIGWGRFSGGLDGADLAAGYQNYILVGLLLLMFAIVPNQASEPPASWFRQSSPG